MARRIYISQQNSYEKATRKKYLYAKNLKIDEVESAVILPENEKFTGGIYKSDSSQLKYVAGINSDPNKKHNYHKNNIELTDMRESAIYGGGFSIAFGHLLLEGLSRLWYIIANPQDKRKILFIGYGFWSQNTLTKDCLYQFLKLLNIDEERIVIIEKPTQFKHITIPEISVLAWKYYTKEYPQLYRHFAMGANRLCNGEQSFDKIYLSHSKWGHRPEQSFLNEQIYEEFFKNRGYEIIYPEEFSVTQMAYLMNNAKEVATTMGSTAHLALFCKENTRFIILTRECNTQPPLIPQCLINEAMNLDWFIINANNNFLPSFDQNTGWGVVNFAFTDDFKEFCKDYFESDFSEEFSQKVDELEYFKAWTQFYSNPHHFKTILANLTPFDFVNKMSEVFFGVALNKNAFTENASNTPEKSIKIWYERFWRHLRTLKF